MEPKPDLVVSKLGASMSITLPNGFSGSNLYEMKPFPFFVSQAALSGAYCRLQVLTLSEVYTLVEITRQIAHPLLADLDSLCFHTCDLTSALRLPTVRQACLHLTAPLPVPNPSSKN